MDEKDPWVLLSRPAEWDDAMVEQGFSPRACERRARKTNYILLGAAVLAGLVFCVFGGGLNGGAAALTAVLCMGSPLSSTLIAGFASLRLQQTAAASGAVIPGWAAIEELGGVDTVQADADELFTPDSAMLEDIRIFKGGRIDRAILYSASVLSKCCNTLSGLFRQIIEDRTDILYPVKDLEVHRGLGFSAWCDNNRILIGTRAYMEKEEVPLPDEEYEAKHSKNGELQILYLAVSGSLHAMFVLHYVGGRNAARGLEQLQKENIQLLVSCQDPTLTAPSARGHGRPAGPGAVCRTGRCHRRRHRFRRLLHPLHQRLCQPDRRSAGCRAGPERRDDRYHGAAGVGVVLGGHRRPADLCRQRGDAERGCGADVSGGMERSQHRRVRTQAA